MKFYFARKKNSDWHIGLEGLVIMLAFFPFALSSAGQAEKFEHWRLISAVVSSLSFLTASYFCRKSTGKFKFFILLGVCFNYLTAFPLMIDKPSAALFITVVFLLAFYHLDSLPAQLGFSRAQDSPETRLKNTRWSAITLMCMSIASFLLLNQSSYFSEISLFTAVLVVQLLSIIWSVFQPSNFFKAGCIVLNAITLMLLAYFFQQHATWAGSLIACMALLVFLPGSSGSEGSSQAWLDLFLQHPARVSMVTFFILCLVGALLLHLPIASAHFPISLIDAAFTSVSAVCVTGLIVLDTPNDFSITGQLLILLLIQLGGLGIMTITTAAFYMLGKKLSISQEKLLSSAYNSDYSNISRLLLQIVKFTAVFELAGAALLSILFWQQGFSATDSIWKGIFTSISAFCNAGFALQSDSLIPFQNSPLILYVVSALIIFGGLSPAITLAIPAWAKGENVNLSIRIAIITTIILLVAGTFVFLAFEWNNSLADLSIAGKLHNAFFQSVTLRTAGFNSIALENVLGPTLIMMLCMMFIGGCPGGTAGGIKTVTFSLLMAVFWKSISGYDEITMQKKRILATTVFKAVTITVAGVLVLLTTIFMLQATQKIDSRNIIFEATSALGTVGLSLGATGKIDDLGKFIIMLTMFAGRIGPLTLFTLLSRDRNAKVENYLDASINLT